MLLSLLYLLFRLIVSPGRRMGAVLGKAAKALNRDLWLMQ